MASTPWYAPDWLRRPSKKRCVYPFFLLGLVFFQIPATAPGGHSPIKAATAAAAPAPMVADADTMAAYANWRDRLLDELNERIANAPAPSRNQLLVLPGLAI